MNYILFSANEGFKGGVDKIKSEALKQNKKCETIKLEDISEEKILHKMTGKNSLVYFLTNDISIREYVELFKTSGIKVINETLLLNNPLKFTMQQKVFADGVCIPKSSLIFKHIRTETTRYPLFIKSQKQADIVIYAQNNDEFRGKMASIKNISGYYIEEAIIEKGMVLKKFYYINGTMVEMNSVSMSEIPKWLNKVLTTISQSLHLEVFSVDIFVNWSSEKYYCIDINPASAFFNSDTARKEFVKNILL